MRRARRLAVPLFLALVVLIVLLAIRPLPTARSLAIFLVLLTAIALRELVRIFNEDDGRRPGFEATLHRHATAPPEPSVFAEIERELALSIAYADHAHRWLLPRLRAAAAARLSMRHGIELERRPEAARRLLGEKTWDYLRPDRPRPSDGLERGPRREEIAAVISQLEGL